MASIGYILLLGYYSCTRTRLHMTASPLKTSLNSPGGALLMKLDTIRTWTRYIHVQVSSSLEKEHRVAVYDCA